MELGEPDVEEFIELNRVLERMTMRLSSDYRELREYTDHTTHELQTPLAVIKTKIELLMQSSNLGSDEMQLLQSISTSTNHLSRLNSTLALITRIENQQYTQKVEISPSELLDKHLEMFQELVELRNISVERSYSGKERLITMDSGLADILVTNLLKNSIVHNVEGGKILIAVNDGALSISNDGPALSFNEQDLFKRFVRDTKRTGNFGLGLSLVKKICDYYSFEISYTYENSRHIFKIVFFK